MRRFTACAAAVALLVVGTPLPASAADEGSPPAQRPLLLNGQPLSRLLYPASVLGVGSRPNVPAGQDAGGGPPQQSTTGNKARRGPLFWTAVGAGIGGAAGLLMLSGKDCDQPENLCPLGPIMGATTGAMFGLLFGLGR